MCQRYTRIYYISKVYIIISLIKRKKNYSFRRI